MVAFRPRCWRRTTRRTERHWYRIVCPRSRTTASGDTSYSAYSANPPIPLPAVQRDTRTSTGSEHGSVSSGDTGVHPVASRSGERPPVIRGGPIRSPCGSVPYACGRHMPYLRPGAAPGLVRSARGPRPDRTQSPRRSRSADNVHQPESAWQTARCTRCPDLVVRGVVAWSHTGN